MEEINLSMYDRNMIEYLTTVLDPNCWPKEHTETGVTSIEMAASSTFNRDFVPLGGEVKWFRDEMGQRWVKFKTARLTSRDGTMRTIPGTLKDRVWPASRVIEVQYDKPDEVMELAYVKDS